MGYCQEENDKQETKKNADELKATVKETLVSIQCQKLITSMPRRIEAAIKAKGAPDKVLSTYTISEHTFQKANNSQFFSFGLKYSNLLR